MMSEEQFIESQKECASMLGMTLSEYQEYCKNVKVPELEESSNEEDIDYTLDILNSLGIDQNKLKTRKD